MSATAKKRKPKLMHIAVYRVENHRSPSILRKHGEDAFALRMSLRCLARDEVFGDSEQAAAAKVWFDSVGRWKLELLCECNAPETIIAGQDSPQKIESRLILTSLLEGIGYLLDDGHEVWLITVDWDWVETRNYLASHEEESQNV